MSAEALALPNIDQLSLPEAKTMHVARSVTEIDLVTRKRVAASELSYADNEYLSPGVRAQDFDAQFSYYGGEV